MDSYVDSVNLSAKYMISNDAYAVFKEMREDNISDYLVRGLRSFYKKDNSPIVETLFFYPLIGILNKLSYALAIKKN